MAVVEYLDHGRWAEVVLNRPERRNAINGPLGEALAAAIKRAGDDDGIQAVLLRGADGAFCSGLDLKAFNADPPPDWMPRFPAIWRRAHKAIFECRKPIVVALERFAINGGAALALAADLLVTGETAFLQVGEVRQGLAAPYNMAWLRLRHGESTAAQLTLTGRRFAGSQLASLGIAYAAVPDDDVAADARRLVEELAAYPDGALARNKALLRAYNDIPADDWFDRATRQTGPRVRPQAVQ
ncbi:MAG: enoyl-CoA hydratase/isomerase family protein [Gammaproteobacteria bacterium]|nr:enoyl-CoA hydratase/isomerase family protein [Gammaproteobacteria bacterium]MYF28428.1 enoyl-CoA hydratase/isomerase family protein [Gammaproteobacteria bacterium]MYK45794.1 enoyl-CoA hydratase/isomerase family protein [Gammaproteobacteria bacterium]